MLGRREGNAGGTRWALEEVPAVQVVTQQVLRGRRSAVAVGAEDCSHGTHRTTAVLYSP